MRALIVAVASLAGVLSLVAGLASAAPGHDRTASQAFSAWADERGLHVSNLRLSSMSAQSCSVKLLGSTHDAAAAAAQLSAAPALDFDLTRDGANDSWTLDAALPRGAGQPAAVEVWCRSCRSGGGGQEVTGLVGRQAVQGSGLGAAGTVVLALEGAVLPGSHGPEPAAATARRLQAAAPASCELTVGGQAYSFASCSQAVATASLSLTVYSTVVSDGAGSIVKMGMAARTGGGWAGWGLPATPGVMVGARAVIVWPTSSGASVDGFQLPSEIPAAVNAAMGTFNISDAAADSQGGELHAVFTVSLPGQAPGSLTAASGVDYIFAIGPMSGSGTPGLGDHTLGAYPYGGGRLVMKLAGSAAPGPSPQAEAGASSPPPSPATTATPSSPAEEEEEGGDGDSDSDSSSSESQAEPAASPSLASSGAAAPGSASDPTGCVLQLGTGGVGESFTHCTQISRLGKDFYLMWRTEPVQGSPAKLNLTMGMNATTDGYVAVGFPARAGRMSGATAMILQTCSAGSAGCTGGAQLQQWFLGSTSASDVQPSNGMAITGLQAAAVPGTGQLVGRFQLEVDAPAAATGRKLLLLESSDGSMPLIFAAGAVGSDGRPLQHSVETSATLPLLSSDQAASAQLAADGSGNGGDSASSLQAAHAWLAAIGWGVLIPIGIVFARSFKGADPLWFHLHRGIQTLGLIMGLVSLGLGFALVDGEWHAEDYEHAVHRNLGVACTVLGCTQLSALALRPQKGHRYRFAWELWHHWVGRSAAVLAIANIYYGILHMWELGTWAWASYTAVLAAIVAVSLGKDAADWWRARRSAPTKSSASDAERGSVEMSLPPSTSSSRV